MDTTPYRSQDYDIKRVRRTRITYMTAVTMRTDSYSIMISSSTTALRGPQKITTNERTNFVMNKKTLKRILPKIAILLALLTLLTVAMSSCGSNTVITVKEDPTAWKDTTVNLEQSTGFLDKLLSWIGTFLGWITKVMPANSYILTLFVFAIILEIVMLPFSVKQQKNSIKQAKLRPKEMAIRKKYAGRNDQATQQKVTQEIQELYQKENFNPMGGCLPLLIQLPILIVLYWIVVDPIQYVCHMSRDLTSVIYSYITASPEIGGLGQSLASTNGSIEILSRIKDLGPEAFEGIKGFCANGDAVFAKIQEIDALQANFNVGPLNLGLTPSFTPINNVQYWLLAIPVITFFVYFFSMKISRRFSYQPTQNTEDRQAACSNSMMDFTMPLMSVWMTFIVPGAVGIYWVFKSILGTVKQFIMSRVMPLPKFTEEDYKTAEKELLGKQPKKIQKSANAGKVRSLHHIDDEDYDEKGNYCPKNVEESEDNTEETHEKLQENSMTEGAALKDEADKGSSKPGIFRKKGKKD